MDEEALVARESRDEHHVDAIRFGKTDGFTGRMVEVGVLAENERIELIGGDLFVMAAKGYAHEIIKNALVRAMLRAAPDDVEKVPVFDRAGAAPKI